MGATAVAVNAAGGVPVHKERPKRKPAGAVVVAGLYMRILKGAHKGSKT